MSDGGSGSNFFGEDGDFGVPQGYVPPVLASVPEHDRQQSSHADPWEAAAPVHNSFSQLEPEDITPEPLPVSVPVEAAAAELTLDAPAASSIAPGKASWTSASSSVNEKTTQILPVMNTPPPPAAVAVAEPGSRAAAAMPNLERGIQERIAQIDKESMEKEAKTKKLAQAYLQDITTKREQQLRAVKQEHVQQQEAAEKKRSELRKSGAVWNGVGMLVDLKKTNQYSKSTERMRRVLKALDERKSA